MCWWFVMANKKKQTIWTKKMQQYKKIECTHKQFRIECLFIWKKERERETEPKQAREKFS